MDFLPTPDVLPLAGTCHDMRKGVRDLFVEEIGSLVRPFFYEPAAQAHTHIDFWRTLHRNGGVVSGSVALAVALRTPFRKENWVPTDMDVYVPFSSYGHVLTFFLHTMTGYHASAAHSSGWYRKLSSIMIVTSFVNPKLDRRVDLIASKDENSLTPIFGFYGTHVMNWISPDGLFVAYPKLTFNHVALFTPFASSAQNSKQHKHAMVKYKQRGFRFFYATAITHQSSCGSDGYCPQTVRSSFDRYSMGFKLPLLFSNDIAESRGQLEVSRHGVAWRLGGKACKTELITFQTDFFVQPIIAIL